MRIVQIIDSLEAGGAERMAVNYANALADMIEFSGLIVTRSEGVLKQQINSNVNYFFLNRLYTFDVKAIYKLRRFCISNSITHIHAHSTSFFLATLLKIIYPSIKIIWHDHYGWSTYLKNRKHNLIKICSFLFYGIITVNLDLKAWAEQKLYCTNILFLRNFITQKENSIQETFLSGNEKKRILCLANLRPQKNHYLLIAIAKKIKIFYPDWSFHLVGKDFNDNYALDIRKKIFNNSLQEHVFIYGSRNDIFAIINQSDICILTSKSEGLPVSLLEYGISKKAVVTTNVGNINNIITNAINGFLVTTEDVDDFYTKITMLIEDTVLRDKLSNNLYHEIVLHYTEEAVIQKYLHWINKK
jgi:glycosyltransferase involved in cell wall biosynthesis